MVADYRRICESFYRRLIYALSYQWEIAPNSMVHNLFEGTDKT